MTRIAACSCGQLQISCEGEPVRRAVCHCLACQSRTGSAFGVQVRFPAVQVRASGQATSYQRTADSGSKVTFQFCPVCGSTLYWTLDAFPGVVAVAFGNFADPGFAAPEFSVFEKSKHPWVQIAGDIQRSI
jgi:hypothetical protein